MTPTASRPVLRFPRPAVAWAAASGMLALIGWYKGINLLLIFGYFLLALVGVNLWLAYRMVRGLTAVRRAAPVGFADEPIHRTVEVENSSPSPVTALVVERTPDRPTRWLLAPLPAGGRETLRTQFTYPARGRYVLGPVALESEYPLGLVRWVAELAPPGEQLVLPAVGRVDMDALRRWVARAAGGEGRSRRPARRPSPGHGDIRGVRPYRNGDSPRDIHWRTTARRNQLVVREYDQTDPLNLVVVLDPWVPATADKTDARLEWALALAVSIGWALATADEPGDLTLVIPGSPPTVRTGRATQGFVRDAFAPLATLDGTPDVPPIAENAVRASATRTARIVVGTRPDSPLLVGLRRAGVPAASVDPSAPPGWYLPRSTISW